MYPLRSLRSAGTSCTYSSSWLLSLTPSPRSTRPLEPLRLVLSPEGFNHVAYHTVIKNDDVVFELEELRRPCDGASMLMIHARCARWSPQIFKETLKQWELLRSVVPQPIFASPQVHDAKWEKFVTLFGFQPLIAAAPCNDGETRPIWIHYGKLHHPDPAVEHDSVGTAGRCATDGL
jgi:hypothetical protein